MKIVVRLITILATVAVAFTSEATPYDIFPDRTSFLDAVGSTITDDYDSYGTAILTDVQMSAVLNETKYHTTYWPDNNDVGENSARDKTAYCAGCNGSFLLDFTSTSIGSSKGVFGVALDIVVNDPAFPYHAFVTFGSGQTLDILLPSFDPDLTAPFGFFGIIAQNSIESIAFGAAGGVPTRDGGFIIDTLTIASRKVLPEPATLALLGIGLAGLGFARRRKQ